MSGPALVVFAAGKGTRLRPLTDRLPKPMVPVLDVPMVDLALARGRSTKWDACFVNVSGPSPGLREHLASLHPTVTILEEGDEPVGQAATLRRLLPRLTDPVVTCNSDLVSDMDLGQLLHQHAAAGRRCTLAVSRVEGGADLTATADGTVTLLDRRFENSAGYLFLGAACFTRPLLEAIPPLEPLGLVTGVLRGAVASGDVALYEHRGFAEDAGSLDRYLSVSVAALGRPELCPSTPGEVSRDRCYRGPGTRISAGAVLDKGAIVLAGASVGDGARLRDCIVWPSSEVPEGSDLTAGIWFDGRWLEAGTAFSA
ncbi:MAG TPA: NDP-sugar synthase [Actinomycetota bacterium]|nr:NDP-sugar synthase [Actinomycetota bacterium]